MARWLGLDHGTKRIGIAVGDAATKIASPVAPLSADSADLAAHIARLAAQYDAVGIVVGWPINDDGSEGPQARQARQFAADLAGKTGLDVRLWDERLSSFEADQRLRGHLTRQQKRRRHDAVAAGAFLEDFLSRGGSASAPRATDEPDNNAGEKQNGGPDT